MNRLAAVERLLAELPGIVGVSRVRSDALEAALAEETRYEQAAFMPLRNVGVREVHARAVALALLKNGLFREPPAPTVYLVEPAGDPAEGPSPEPVLEAGGVHYRILGEEVLAARPARVTRPGEKTVFLADSFVMFPERRASPRTPSFFLMPPLGFPELEEREQELGIRGVVSISPSSLADVALRAACGFPADASLASLLVGFDWAEPA